AMLPAQNPTGGGTQPIPGRFLRLAFWQQGAQQGAFCERSDCVSRCITCVKNCEALEFAKQTAFHQKVTFPSPYFHTALLSLTLWRDGPPIALQEIASQRSPPISNIWSYQCRTSDVS